MSCNIHILALAVLELQAIEDWYIQKFDKHTAAKVSSSILMTIGRLSDHPDSGSFTSDPLLNELGYRMLIIKRHIAIYRCIDDDIYVYMIADSKTEYTKLLLREIGEIDEA